MMFKISNKRSKTRENRGKFNIEPIDIDVQVHNQDSDE